jgi:hypothetical protein
MGKRSRRPVAAGTPSRRRRPGDSAPASPAPLLVAGGRGGGAPSAAAAADAARTRLASLPAERRRTVQAEESAFAKLGADRLAQLALLATYAPLARPVAPALACFASARLEPPPPLDGEEESDEDNLQLRVPRRPRWHAELDKRAVEANEASVFRQWLAHSDAVVSAAFARILPPPPPSRSALGAAEVLRQTPKAGTAGELVVVGGGVRAQGAACASHCRCATLRFADIRPPPPRSPGVQTNQKVIGSLYERNVEVFRQLWRVCERSDIL